MIKKILILALVVCAGTSFSGPSLSQPEGDLMPPVSGESARVPSTELNAETHPSLNLTPDKSELVTLDRDASSVIVGNPAHVGVLLDTPRLAVVIPRTPGATHFTVLDKDGNVVMQRHVIVAAPKKNYVRVRRSCANAAQGTACQPTSVYFCPDMCHEIGSAEAGAALAPSANE